MSVTAPAGFTAAGVSARLKASGKLDLGLLLSDRPAMAGGLFTTNLFAAAPVVLDKRRLANGSARAIVANSGQANAGTGREGMEDAEAITAAVAAVLGIDDADVLSCSTGVIGPRIDVERAADGLPAGEILQIPIKHGEGQFVASPPELDRLEARGLVAFRYCSPEGFVDDAFNPNGSTGAIAGIRNERGNVLGMMPHPEHAVDPDLGPTGGQSLFAWLLSAARRADSMPAFVR